MSNVRPPKEGIREPAQQRSRETLDRLITAGSELCAERGASGFTLLEVGRRAGVSNGSMYFRIPNREALLYAIQDRWATAADAALLSAEGDPSWEQLDVFATIDKAIRLVADVYMAEPRLLRAFALHAAADEEMARRARDSHHRGALAFKTLVSPRLAQAGHPDPEKAAATLFTAVSGSMASRLTWPDFHLGPPLNWDEFVDYLCAMATAQIRESLA